MAQSYAACTAKYNRLEEELNAKMKNTGPGQNLDKIIAAYNRTLTEKKTELEKLLRENENSAVSDQLDLLRSKIMIEIGRFADAEKIIDRLSLIESKVAAEAKLQKVIIHLIRRRNADALALFKEIEPKIKKDIAVLQHISGPGLFEPGSQSQGRVFAEISGQPGIAGCSAALQNQGVCQPRHPGQR